MPDPGELAARVQRAQERAIGFLDAAQLPSGEFAVVTSLHPDMADAGTPDPSIFPTALMVHCLSFAAGTEALRAKRRPRRDLAAAAVASRQHQRRDVGAADQQHEGDRPGEHAERGFHIADHRVDKAEQCLMF